MTAVARAMPVQKPGKSKQDYATPMPFIAAVERRFGPIVADLAASKENARCPVWYGTDTDSLSMAWGREHPDGNLWLNPPFGDLAPWVEKCAEEARRRLGLILLLVPASIGSNWFADFVHRRAYVLALRPRLTFVGQTDPFPRDLMLAVYGHGCVGLDTWRWDQA